MYREHIFESPGGKASHRKGVSGAKVWFQEQVSFSWAVVLAELACKVAWPSLRSILHGDHLMTRNTSVYLCHGRNLQLAMISDYSQPERELEALFPFFSPLEDRVVVRWLQHAEKWRFFSGINWPGSDKRSQQLQDLIMDLIYSCWALVLGASLLFGFFKGVNFYTLDNRHTPRGPHFHQKKVGACAMLTFSGPYVGFHGSSKWWKKLSLILCSSVLITNPTCSALFFFWE